MKTTTQEKFKYGVSALTIFDTSLEKEFNLRKELYEYLEIYTKSIYSIDEIVYLFVHRIDSNGNVETINSKYSKS